MNYFEDWYTQPIDNEEEDQEKRLALMLQAAADIPTGGLQNDPHVNSGSASDAADFINRMSSTDLIQQLVNGHPADINSWFEDQKDLPTRDQSLYDFLRKPAEPFDDLDFFDRNPPANLFPNVAGSTGLDDDFWGGLQKGLGQEARTPSGDNPFNFLLAKTAEPGQSANSWNSPAEAGKDAASQPDAAMQLKNFQERYPGVKIYAPPDFPIPKKLEAFQKWYDSLPVKPTSADVNVKIVPKGEPGSEKGYELGNTGLVAVPESFEIGGRWDFDYVDIPKYPGQIYNSATKWINRRLRRR